MLGSLGWHGSFQAMCDGASVHWLFPLQEFSLRNVVLGRDISDIPKQDAKSGGTYHGQNDTPCVLLPETRVGVLLTLG